MDTNDIVEINLKNIKRLEGEIETIKGYIKRSGATPSLDMKTAIVDRFDKIEQTKKFIENSLDSLAKDLIARGLTNG